MYVRRWGSAVLALALAMGGTLAVTGTAQAATTTSTIEDTVQGTGLGQVQFSGDWGYCGDNCVKATTDNSFRWTENVGSSATIRFTGNKISLYGMKEPWAYIATAKIDGGAAADVDYYAPAVSATTVPVWTSPALAQGTHTLVLTMTNRHNSASSGGQAITLDRAVVTSDTGSTSPHASGLPWSDGGYFMHDPAQATAFASWRGRPVDNVLAFTDRSTWENQLNPWWGDTVPSTFNATRDDFILGVPLWTDDQNYGTDAQWTQLAQEIAAVDPNGYVRLGWEMNCCFSFAEDATTWRNQYTRAARLIRAAAPGLKLVFNPNEGASKDQLVADPSTLYVAGLVDVIAIDAYDWYPAYNSAANANLHFTQTYGWNWWYNFARSKGLPFAIGEFSVATGSSASGGDNPAYFTYVYDWLKAKNTAAPGSIAFVSLFNESERYCTCNVYPTTANPKAAARYKSIITSLAS